MNIGEQLMNLDEGRIGDLVYWIPAHYMTIFDMMQDHLTRQRLPMLGQIVGIAKDCYLVEMPAGISDRAKRMSPKNLWRAL